MKTEKICISKKNLVISLIVIFLLGVVGVSYMVQRSISVKSRAEAPADWYAKDCYSFFDKKMKEIYDVRYGKDKFEERKDSFDYFKSGYIDNSNLIEYRTTANLAGNPCGPNYSGSISGTDEVEYPGGFLKSRACCLWKEDSNKKSVESAMDKLGLQFDKMKGLSFKQETDDRNTKINSDNYVQEGPKTCINYGAPEGSKERDPQDCDTGIINEEECGPNRENRRYFKVGCGTVGKDRNTSCDFSCFNGVDWNNDCRKVDGTENQRVCLIPSPTPTEPPEANTFNSTNQTSNQAGAEVNPSCTENPDRKTSTRENIYKCYVQAELRQGSLVTTDTSKNLLENSNYFIFLKLDESRKRISRPGDVGRKNNEMCKVNRDQVPTDGICATITNQ